MFVECGEGYVENLHHATETNLGFRLEDDEVGIFMVHEFSKTVAIAKICNHAQASKLSLMMDVVSRQIIDYGGFGFKLMRIATVIKDKGPKSLVSYICAIIEALFDPDEYILKNFVGDNVGQLTFNIPLFYVSHEPIETQTPASSDRRQQRHDRINKVRNPWFCFHHEGNPYFC